MKLLSKERDGKKVRYVYDSAKTPLQRLLRSGVLPVQKQGELPEVTHALDPISLLHQLAQLQQAIFRCAVGCSPFISSLPSAPIHVFSVELCMRGKFPVERSIPDLTAGLETLYREQERRKRVLGWRRTHKDPFAGEWEQIMCLSGCQPRTEQWRHLSGVTTPLPWTLSTITNSHRCFAGCASSEPTFWKPWKSSGRKK
jgi:hypothetical protein